MEAQSDRFPADRPLLTDSAIELLLSRTSNWDNNGEPRLTSDYLKLLGDMGRFKVGMEDSQENAISPYRLPSVSPVSVLKTIRLSHPMFRGLAQHDSQEFLRAFLNDIHEEVKFLPFDDYSHSQSNIRAMYSNGKGETGDDKKLRKKDKQGRKKAKMEANGTATEPKGPPPSTSIVTDVFQGSTLTSVKCLSCQKVYNRNEVFLDISLPLTASPSQRNPKSDHLPLASNAIVASAPQKTVHPKTAQLSTYRPTRPFLESGKDALFHPLDSSMALISLVSIYLLMAFTWMKKLPVLPFIASYFILAAHWFRSLIWSPQLRLEDCLESFFDVDELSGENQYYCERCSKHTNGRMHIKITKLPEVLCLHLKRFRHDFHNTTKILSPVDFPLEGLDLKPFLHSSCADKVTKYNLTGVVCHSGTVHFGHYFAYTHNLGDRCWYEFNDSWVRKVDESDINSLTSSAYVLVYKKQTDWIKPLRRELIQMESSVQDASTVVFISQHWLLRFANFADPGPITNSDFLCSHGYFQPLLTLSPEDYAVPISHKLWQFLLSRFGGGPVVHELRACETCKQKLRELDARRHKESTAFTEAPEESLTMFIISKDWLKTWINFVNGRRIEPPDPINNSSVLEPCRVVQGAWRIRFGSSDRQELISDAQWHLLHSIYGGGPEHSFQCTAPTPPPPPASTPPPPPFAAPPSPGPPSVSPNLPNVTTKKAENGETEAAASPEELVVVVVSKPEPEGEPLDVDGPTEPPLTNGVCDPFSRSSPAPTLHPRLKMDAEHRLPISQNSSNTASPVPEARTPSVLFVSETSSPHSSSSEEDLDFPTRTTDTYEGALDENALVSPHSAFGEAVRNGCEKGGAVRNGCEKDGVMRGREQEPVLPSAVNHNDALQGEARNSTT